MNRLIEMETFVRVVDAGSISGAAERMNTAKSAVSRRLAGLEERLGVRLLNRTTRRLSLTEAGSAFYDRCAEILADVADAEQTVADADADLGGQLRVAAPLSFGLEHLGAAINDFMRQQPGVTFDLDLNDRQIDLVEEGYDVAIRITNLSDSSLRARRLANIRSVVCASPDYWDTHGRPAQPADLKQHTALRYSNAPRRSWSWTAPDGSRGSVTVPVSMTANNGEFLAQTAVEGFGVIVIPVFIAYKRIEAGDLEVIFPDYRWGDIAAYAVYPPTRFLSRRVRVFIDFLAGRFGDEPYWDRCLRGT
jgi:DNA-binding transcriptional LysR family regulator